jgi:hypothetical protein
MKSGLMWPSLVNKVLNLRVPKMVGSDYDLIKQE